jgi:hypothetical protein
MMRLRSPGHLEHEMIVFRRDSAIRLDAIISIDSTVLGPANGGTRALAHGSTRDADVMRLAPRMTYKWAAGGEIDGGGRAANVGDSAVSTVTLRIFGDGRLPVERRRPCHSRPEQMPVAVLRVDHARYGMFRFNHARNGGPPFAVELARGLGPTIEGVTRMGEFAHVLCRHVTAVSPSVVVPRAVMTSPRWYRPPMAPRHKPSRGTPTNDVQCF